MATQNYTTIEKQIAGEANTEYGYRKMHSMITITDQETGNKVIAPYRSLSAEYMDYLRDYIEERELTEIQWQYFKHNPRALSESLYGTTKFWAMLLEINHCRSIMEFAPKTVKYFKVEKITEILNEVLMKEEW